MGRKSKGAKIKAEAKRFNKAPKRNNASTATSSVATPLPSTPTNTYTLADEARNTSQHDHSTWNQSTLLRKKPVLFVSAGLIEPLKLLEDMPEEDEEQTKHTEAMEETREKAKKPHRQVEVHDAAPESNDDAVPNDENEAFFFDVSKPHNTTSKATTAAQAAPITQLRRTPSISSDSSEEVILFQGRRNRTPIAQDQMSLANMKIELSAVEHEIKTPAINGNVRNGTEDDVPNKAQTQPAKSRGRRGGRRARERRQADDDNDENDALLIADYIENMQNSGEMDDITAYIENLQAMQRATDGLSEESDAGESSNDEIDEETLRSLIAGQDMDDGGDNEEAAESSSSSEDDDADVKFLAGLENYGEFDPMDWERPSIRRKRGKGGKAKLDLNLDNIDSDMERTLQAAWRSDRQKKADRKRERQEMRARGLLGKKANPEDTRVKYPAGMTTDQVADEFRSFLIGDAHSLSLPPMDKHCRKMVHELANKFNVKSKSIGKGDQRRPTLYRTLRTAPFKEHAFDQAVNRMTRRYFPRMDQKGKKSGEPMSRSYAATSYRDGDVVGAAAPEIGVENRGRAMLEKMGWSRGTALGTDDNKGILQPVIQTMKKTKAGLG